jgi:hypothetical protein
MTSALLSRNDLNSFGASSGCKLAGTQNNRDASFSSAEGEGGRDGIEKLLPKEGRSGSPAAATSIDMRRIAARLFSSWTTAAGLDS